jgi:hypothetical protein
MHSGASWPFTEARTVSTTINVAFKEIRIGSELINFPSLFILNYVTENNWTG